MKLDFVTTIRSVPVRFLRLACWISLCLAQMILPLLSMLIAGSSRPSYHREEEKRRERGEGRGRGRRGRRGRRGKRGRGGRGGRRGRGGREEREGGERGRERTRKEKEVELEYMPVHHYSSSFC